MQKAKKDLAVQLNTLEEKTTLADIANWKLQDDLRSSCAEFTSYRRESKKESDNMSTFRNEPQKCLPQFERYCVEYYFENVKLSSSVDGLKIEKTTSDCRLSEFLYDYNGAFAKEKEVSDELNSLRAFVEKALGYAELFRSKVSTDNDRFKTNLSEGFAAYLTQLRDATKEFLKSIFLGVKKSVDVSFCRSRLNVPNRKSDINYLEPGLSSVD